MENLIAIQQQIVAAKAQKDWPLLADRLVFFAHELTEAGQFIAAAQALDEATDVYHRLQKTPEAARCSHSAATLYRLAQDLPTAQQRATASAELAPINTPIAVSAAAELGEIAFAQQQFDSAANHYEQAIAYGKQAGLNPDMQAELYRKQARAWLRCDRSDQAFTSLTQAIALTQSDYPTLAIRIQIEQATLLQQTNRFDEATPIIQAAFTQAQGQAPLDYLALADIALMQTTEQIVHDQWAAARTFVLSARDFALQGNAAVQYIGAAIALAEIAHQQSDYLSAYEALVTGWVTLADLMGDEVAQASFKPKLLEMRDRWGSQPFAQIKAQYEASRRSRPI